MAKRKNYFLMAVCAFTLIGIAMVSIEQCVLDRGFSLDDPFKFTIDTNIEMPDDQQEVVITVFVPHFEYDDEYGYQTLYDLDCNGDGEFELMRINQPHNCKFKRNTGKYQIWVRGTIPQIILCPDKTDNQNAVVSVDDWGDIHWRNMADFANHCKNLEKIPQKAPDLHSIYTVRDMSRMFAGAHKFNQPLNHWNVSHVTTMESMFNGATSFNQPLDKWNVAFVENMSYMFYEATSFNQPLDRWELLLTRDMSGMFKNATSFNQPLNHWNVSRVRNMSWMFAGAHQFNQPLNEWNVAGVNDMNHMFYEATSFNQPLNNWRVFNVRNMESMFEKATSFNQPLLVKWDMSKVLNMQRMFYEAASFSYYPYNLRLNDSNIGMFKGTKVEEELSLEPFKLIIDTDLSGREHDVVIPINVYSVDELYRINYDLDCDGDGEYEKSGLIASDKCIFKGGTGKHQIWVRGSIPWMKLCKNFDKSRVDSIVSIEDWGGMKWRSMEGFANGCLNLEKIPKEPPNLSAVESMASMFLDAQKFNQPLNEWDVSNVRNMAAMFAGAHRFNQPLNKWHVDNVKNMSHMFKEATSFNQPLNEWHVDNVTDMSYMFKEATSFNQPLDDWNVFNVRNMESMFKNATSFSYYPKNWIVPKRKTDYMFTGTKVEEMARQQPLGSDYYSKKR